MSILIITHSRDNAATKMVIDAIEARDEVAIRVDTDHYPTGICISSRFEGDRWHRKIRSGKASSDLSDVTALWYRRWYTGQHLPGTLGTRRAHCVAESKQTLYGTIAAMGVYEIDRWVDVRGADAKELQVRRAAECGLVQPATMFSNDPEEVVDFYNRSPDGLITKMQSMFAIYEDDTEKVVFTSIVERKHLEQLSGLQYSPMLFQHKINKTADIRCTVVGNKVFSAILTGEHSESAGIDWRTRGEQIVEHWAPYELPADIETNLLKFVRSYGLQYAAVDFVLDENKEHFFLEVNATGEWCWIAQSTGLPIADALAEQLIAGQRV